jgi:N4-gp56 family major capsid protein
MALTTFPTLASDVEQIIGDNLLPLSRKHICVYDLGEKVKMPKNRGTTFTFIRYNRIRLPTYPLSEGSPAISQPLAPSEVTGTVQQWGLLITLTDRATYAVKHDTIKIARERMQMALAELLDRNTFLTWQGFSQQNTANSKGTIGNLTATDTLQIFDLERSNAILRTMGAYEFDGNDDVNPHPTEQTAEGSRSIKSAHWIVVMHPNVASDIRSGDPKFTQASAYSDVNKLYGNEVGQWAGHRVIASNMVPYWTGFAAISGTAGASGNLVTGSYFIQVTSSDPIWGFEQNIYQPSGSIAVTGPNGSISVVLPASSFLFNVYIGTTSAPVNLGVASGIGVPTTGPAAGMATGLQGGQTVIITGLGIPQVPPPAPATGITVYQTYVLGKYAFCQLELMEPTIHYLGEAEKIDPHNQQRMVSAIIDYATCLLNNMWMVKIASSSGFGVVFS